MGNVVGFNIFNIVIIFGIMVLLCFILVYCKIIKIDVLIVLGLICLLLVLLLNDFLGCLEGLLLFVGIVVYMVMNVVFVNKEFGNGGDGDVVFGILCYWIFDIIFMLGGLGIFIFGLCLLVDYLVILVKGFGVSEVVIGLIIVVVGISMLELVILVVVVL